MLKKILRYTFYSLMFLILGLMVAGAVILRDRHPRYILDIQKEVENISQIEAGFFSIPITPEVKDSWKDANQDGQFSIEQGDYYEDLNGNDQFDPVYLAGFQNNRPAAGIHDGLWARAMVLHTDSFTLGIVALDLIGLMHDQVVDIRTQIAREVNIDYTIVVSTHNHEGPDVLGLWGPKQTKSGVDKEYLQLVVDRAAAAVVEAYKRKEPVEIRVAQDLTSANHLVEDSRAPYILDIGVRIVQFISQRNKKTIGTLCAWANHPETLWNKNYQITSDFPHYVRTYLENGITHNDSIIRSGLGGTAIYINGAIGGLMTTSPRFGIEDPVTDSFYIKPSFEKADAQGKALAMIALDALQKGDVVQSSNFKIHAKTLHLPIKNKLFRMATALRVLDQGLSGWITTRSELCVWKLGPMTFLHQPGEMYPEMVNGGVESPEGGDYQIAPIETPGLRSLMPGDYKFIVGLSNDMIGYIIPKSEWDQKPPFLYGQEEETYGEINSLGPDTAPIIYEELKNMLSEF